VAVLINTHQQQYWLVEILEYDERFITFSFWPREDADLPKSWDLHKESLAAITISYEDIQAIEFNPEIVRGHEIGFSRSAEDGWNPSR
jgi:hypothetical protein